MIKVISAVLALTAGFAMANDYTIATGGEGGGYERLGHSVGQSIQAQAKKKRTRIDYEVINTTGSLENIELLNEGEANIAIVQADALMVAPPKVAIKTKTAHKEYAFWIYNKKFGISDLEDLEGQDKYRMMLVEDSGATVTMRSFVQQDSGYEVVLENAGYADDLYDAVDAVAEGKYNGKKVAGVLYVGRSIPTEITQDFGQRIALGEATDGDFNDAVDFEGDKLYQFCDIPQAAYAGLKSSTFGSPETVCLSAMVVYTTDFKNKKERSIVKKGITKALRGLK